MTCQYSFMLAQPEKLIEYLTCYQICWMKYQFLYWTNLNLSVFNSLLRKDLGINFESFIKHLNEWLSYFLRVFFSFKRNFTGNILWSLLRLILFLLMDCLHNRFVKRLLFQIHICWSLQNQFVNLQSKFCPLLQLCWSQLSRLIIFIGFFLLCNKEFVCKRKMFKGVLHSKGLEQKLSRS